MDNKADHSFWKNFTWKEIRPLIYIGLFLLIVLLVLFLYKIVIGTNLVNDVKGGKSYIIFPIPASSPSTSDILTQTQNILSFVAVIITLVTIAVALILWQVKNKIEKFYQIEERFNYVEETLNKTLRIGMETSILGLPKLDESQHIPHEVAKIAHQIDNILVKNPGLVKEIDDNGAKVRLVRALHYFAIADYDKCIEYLSEIVEKNIGDLEIRRDACYRLGIAYREVGHHSDSIKCFSRMENYR